VRRITKTATRGALPLILVGVLALAACGDDGDDGASRDEYVEAMLASTNDPQFSEEENRCLAESFVDGIGVDTLADAGVDPDDIADVDNPGDLGLEISDAQGDAFYERVTACVDVRSIVVDGIAEGASPEQAACVEANVDDDLVKQFIITIFTEGSAGTIDSELVQAVSTALGPCMVPGSPGA
jgi:hypothetical protein